MISYTLFLINHSFKSLIEDFSYHPMIVLTQNNFPVSGRALDGRKHSQSNFGMVDVVSSSRRTTPTLLCEGFLRSGYLSLLSMNKSFYRRYINKIRILNRLFVSSVVKETHRIIRLFEVFRDQLPIQDILLHEDCVHFFILKLLPSFRSCSCTLPTFLLLFY